MLAPIHLILLFPLLPALLARKITVQNSCAQTIWPGMHTSDEGTKPTQPTGWELKSGGTTSFTVADNWTAGRIWARTGCVVQGGVFGCLSGGCGSGAAGDITCQNADQPPATLAEFTLATTGSDNYDISLVDGFNMPLTIHVSDSSCTSPKCDVNINALCPPILRAGLDQNNQNMGCAAACNLGFGMTEFGNRDCCTGAYNDPIMCSICGVDFYNVFKDACPQAYAYAYDEKSGTALFTCPSTGSSKPDYTIEFCPNGSDYVGPANANQKYVAATASCPGNATAWSSKFTVGPTPTALQKPGALQVVETVGTGIDGAAAVNMGAGSASTSYVPTTWHDKVTETKTAVSTITANSSGATVVYSTITASGAGGGSGSESPIVIQIQQAEGGTTTVTAGQGGQQVAGVQLSPGQVATSTLPIVAPAASTSCKHKGGQWLHGTGGQGHKKRAKKAKKAHGHF